jgi:hypothetical protein
MMVLRARGEYPALLSRDALEIRRDDQIMPGNFIVNRMNIIREFASA